MTTVNFYGKTFPILYPCLENSTTGNGIMFVLLLYRIRYWWTWNMKKSRHPKVRSNHVKISWKVNQYTKVVLEQPRGHQGLLLKCTKYNPICRLLSISFHKLVVQVIKVVLRTALDEPSHSKKYTKIPSSIYSWSIGHILEHEFFCLGHLGCAGSKGKKVDLRNSEQLFRVVFSTFGGQKKNLKFF